MEPSIGSYTLSNLHADESLFTGLRRLRLALGWTMLLATMVGLFAVIWDIQWHITVGRDRTLTMPHLFILGSITVTGLTALAAVLIETVWARRSRSVAQQGTPFARVFSSSLGAYLVGYGALAAAIAFPLDQYWHTLYGVDVDIWAPFHLMVLGGMSVACLGVIYLLAESAQMAAELRAQGAERLGYIGVIVACATLLGNLSFLLPDALKMGYLALGNVIFTVYPLMLGAFALFVMMLVIRVLPWRAAATSMTVVYLLLGLVNFLLIPPLMALNLHLEQQHLLRFASTVPSIAVEWQYGLLIPAVLLDIIVWVAQRAKWPPRRTHGVTFVVASIGVSLAALLYPLFLVTARELPHSNVALVVVISLLLGLLGIWAGYLLGAGIGESMWRKQS
ncbi:hypothetical protein KSC_029710 [Ktedonobacter sp. SOSP1-52]|uniref:hypothetical protein n=1 Tax=Ktedonobacter sp. SOSP1-52 TaxID=2778366 RepID=UPI00191565F5|nr:hypothetical protein [Ktedonobacter sp. SOSP1-52]GHO64079.1 hypothetical protein KSC_029710 [Ktedonobacter sp. SOSP1-52]